MMLVQSNRAQRLEGPLKRTAGHSSAGERLLHLNELHLRVSL